MTSIDVAIPCYQYGRFLPDCIDSLTSQGVERLRILIIDNASTDGSLDIARRLAAADPRIEILARPRNLGPHASFNAGIDWATADYFMILCADDLLAPGALGAAAAVLARNETAAFACGSEIAWRSGTARPDLPARQDVAWHVQSGTQFLEERCRDPMDGICTGMVLVRTAAQKQAGHYRPELLYYDDHEMLLRLANLGPVARTVAVQGIRRLHDGNMSYSYNKTRLDDLRHRQDAFRSFFQREGAQREDLARLKRLASRNFAARAYWWAVRELCHGNVGAAAGLLRFVATSGGSRMLLPPLGYLIREKSRLGQVAPARMMAWLQAAVSRAD